MQKPILEVSYETVQAVVRQEFRFTTAPLNATLSDLGLTYADLIKLKAALRKVFAMDIRISLNDSLKEITNKMRNEIQ